MTTIPDIRRATVDDIPTISRIVNDWVDRTEWMPRAVGADDITGFIAAAVPDREIWLIGDPAEGYLSLNPENGQIGALYLDHPGQGYGKALMDRAKERGIRRPTRLPVAGAFHTEIMQPAVQKLRKRNSD